MADFFNQIAPGLAVLIAAALSWVMYQASVYLREKTHNERLARLTDAMSRIAGDISIRLAELPPGSDLKAVKDQALRTGTADIKASFAETIKALGGAADPQLNMMISGELGKLPTVQGVVK